MVEPLSPWANERDDASPLDREVSRMFRAIPEPKALADLAQQRVALRLRTQRRRRGGLMLVRLVAVGIVVGLGGAAFAHWASARFFPARSEVLVQAPRRLPSASLAPQPALPGLPPVAAPSAELAPEAAPGPSSAPFPNAAPAVSQTSQLGLEAASLEAALSALRGGAATRALRHLDAHLQEFPHGALELEARVARVDALLMLGRRQDARRELSGLPIESVGRKQELRLIRAELRADDDCTAALGDFQVLVGQTLPTAWAERALFGRGACLLKLGDKVGAERDFQHYLARFPAGRFAEQIRAQRGR